MKDEMRFTVLHVNGVNVPISDDGKLVSLISATQAIRPHTYTATISHLKRITDKYGDISTVTVPRMRRGHPEISCCTMENMEYLVECLGDNSPGSTDLDAWNQIFSEMQLRMQSPFTKEDHQELQAKLQNSVLTEIEAGASHTTAGDIGVLMEYPFTKNDINFSLQVIVAKNGTLLLPLNRLCTLLGVPQLRASQRLQKVGGGYLEIKKFTKVIPGSALRDLVEAFVPSGTLTYCVPLSKVSKFLTELSQWKNMVVHPEWVGSITWLEANVIPKLKETAPSKLPLKQFLYGMTTELTTKSLCDASEHAPTRKTEKAKVVEVAEKVTTLEPKAKQNKKNILHLVNPVTKASGDYAPPKDGAFSLATDGNLVLEHGRVLSPLPMTSALSEEGYLAVTRALNRAQEVAAAFGVPKEAIGPNLIRAVEEQTGVDLSWLRNPKAEVRMINFGAQDPFAHVHAKLDASPA